MIIDVVFVDKNSEKTILHLDSIDGLGVCTISQILNPTSEFKANFPFKEGDVTSIGAIKELASESEDYDSYIFDGEKEYELKDYTGEKPNQEAESGGNNGGVSAPVNYNNVLRITGGRYFSVYYKIEGDEAYFAFDEDSKIIHIPEHHPEPDENGNIVFEGEWTNFMIEGYGTTIDHSPFEDRIITKIIIPTPNSNFSYTNEGFTYIAGNEGQKAISVLFMTKSKSANGAFNNIE